MALTGGLDAATDSGAESDDQITNNREPVFSGTADSNALITLEINGQTYTTTASSGDNGLGDWSIGPLDFTGADDNTY